MKTDFFAGAVGIGGADGYFFEIFNLLQSAFYIIHRFEGVGVARNQHGVRRDDHAGYNQHNALRNAFADAV